MIRKKLRLLQSVKVFSNERATDLSVKSKHFPTNASSQDSIIPETRVLIKIHVKQSYSAAAD